MGLSLSLFGLVAVAMVDFSLGGSGGGCSVIFRMVDWSLIWAVVVKG